MYIQIPNAPAKIYYLSQRNKIRITDWLISNTTLTIEQIAKVTDLDLCTAKKVLNENIAKDPPLDPIEKGFITQEKIDFIPIYEKIQKKLKTKIIDDIDILLEQAEIDELNEKSIFSVKMIKVYYLLQGHNAWWGVWSDLFDDKGGFHISFQLARQYAEKQRTQGRVFTIIEVPAICFYTKKGIFIIVNINCQNKPFNLNYRSFDEFKNYIKIKEFNESYPHYIVLKHNKNVYLHDIQNDHELYKYTSYIDNGDMEFDKCKMNFDMKYIRSALNTFTKILKQGQQI